MAETFAASGITQLYDTFRSVKKYTNPALKIDGVLLTRTERTRVTKTIQELTGKIAEYMGADVYRTTSAATSSSRRRRRRRRTCSTTSRASRRQRASA